MNNEQFSVKVDKSPLQGWKCIADVLTCIFYLLECSEGWCASTEMVCPADITETIQC